MRISGFVHGITNPELIKRLHDKIPKTVDEMMRVTTYFLTVEVAASNHERKKSFPPWKQQEDKDKGTKGPMIIEAEIGGHCIHRMYLNGGSASEILYEHCFNRLRLEIKNQLVPATTPLIGFSGEIIWPIGQIQLLVRIGDEEHSASAWMNFVVVRRRSNYPKKQQVGSAGMRVGLRTRRDPQAPKPMVEERVKMEINPEYPEQTIMIGSTLIEEGRNKLCNLLQRNLDIFAWKTADMTGVPRHIAEHRLNVRDGCSPVTQKKRGQTADRNQAIQEEVGKIVEAGIMKKVHYHDWLSNPVMVKKHDGSWRMCVDFKDLNKACPKYGYPLPEIDWKVESLCGFPFKCFLDVYKGYHQIQMAKKDEDNSSFITSQAIFYYTKMPFGLRNAGATYQRLVDKAFHKQIGRNLKVYVDNLVIKIRTEDEIVRDIKETFKTLREINMKLNPKKCTFRVEEGMFLGYKVNTKGLKVCPDKVDVVLSLPSPRCLKDVQKLNGKLASLNRFLAKSAEKSLPFFKTLKKCTKKSDFHWTTEAEEAFKQMKQLIAELPMLTAPMEKEELIVYLAAAKETVSAVLMTEREAKQMPIYFVSRALRGPEVNYTSMEKPRVSVKGQILVDFIVERPEEESSDTLMEVEEELPEPWILFTDGSSCTDGSEAGLILTNPEGMEFTYALRFRFDATNNEAEYEALIAGLRIADKQVLVEELKEKSISEVEILAVVEEEGDTWMTPIFEYLKDETLPVDVKKARAHARRHAIRCGKSLTELLSGATIVKRCKGTNKSGIDIAGPFPEGPGKVKFLIVAMDYFTKWIKAKPVTTITGNQIKKFMWDNITNGLVERANRSLGEGIKARLGARNKKWMEELSHVLWAHRTMIKSSNGDTPFSSTYGTKAVIPAEIGMPTLRTAEVDLVKNNEALKINLDLLEERREQAAIREAKSKARMKKYYNSKVKNTSFKPGDLVYRNNDASRTEDTGKLGPKWEGPYEVTEALGKGAYKLRDRDGKQLPQTWNFSNLKKCYIHKM
ncbi:reverse transcriptase domain-containing protein [Tanacetum coccineum]